MVDEQISKDIHMVTVYIIGNYDKIMKQQLFGKLNSYHIIIEVQ